jgi:hypothetical protein
MTVAWRELRTVGVAWNSGVFQGLLSHRVAGWLGVIVSLTPVSLIREGDIHAPT